jgi:DNA-binding NtrC family response regulator
MAESGRANLRILEPGELAEPGQTATVVRDEPRGTRGGRRTLQVLGERFRATFPLAGSGRVTIGRASDNLVSIDDPEISRHHVVLHLGDAIRLEDLGSSNGTKVADRRLEPTEAVALQPGQVIEIGSTLLLIQEWAVEAPAFRLWPHDYFEARLDEECRRCARTGGRFTILHVRADPLAEATVIERRLVSLMPRLDVVARYVPGEYQVLLVGTQDALSDEHAPRLAQGLSDGRVTAYVGAAVYPDDGRTVDELVSVASARCGDHDEASDDNEPTHRRRIVVDDGVTRGVFRLAEKVAAGSITVLVCGETGVGKGVVAEEIHRRSGRDILHVVDCTGLDATEVERTLAPFDDPSATIVLDEIGALASGAQLAMLRWLEPSSRDDGTRPGARIVATTNLDTQAAIAEGRLREDLYFRLEGALIRIPPLRERRQAIEPLAVAFAEEAASRLGRSDPPTLSDEAVAMLRSYHWPGNIRELRNMMRRAVLLCDAGAVVPQHLPVEKLTANYARAAVGATVEPLHSVRQQFREVERERIVAALEQAGGNQTEAAKLLGISRRTLIKRLDAYQLPRPRKRV